MSLRAIASTLKALLTTQLSPGATDIIGCTYAATPTPLVIPVLLCYQMDWNTPHTMVELTLLVDGVQLESISTLQDTVPQQQGYTPVE